MNKVIITLALIVVAALTFSSCQKEVSFEQYNQADTTGTGSGSGSGSGNGSGSGTGTGTADPAALIGDWAFVVLNGKEISGGTAKLLGTTTRSEEITEYATTANAGTLSIAAAKWDFKGLAYEYSTQTKLYLNGAVVSGVPAIPASGTLSPSTTSADYKLIGADSVALTGGDFIGFSELFDKMPTGFRYKIDGKKLTVTIKQYESEDISASGVNGTSYSSTEMKLTFQKP